jgi:predicted alpha/beta superfamily hydrolase
LCKRALLFFVLLRIQRSLLDYIFRVIPECRHFSVKDSAGVDFACAAALPADYGTSGVRYPVVYLMGGADVLPVMDLLRPHFGINVRPFILVGIEGKDWNAPFSPWPEPKLGKNLGPFAGGGPEFLKMLLTQVKPFADGEFRTLPDAEDTALAGYSLAGLLTLYALFNCAEFSRFACMSGSLWFPDFVNYAASHKVIAGNPRLFLSLGDKEKESRNPLMSKVDECTRNALAALSPLNPHFESNPGGHFNEVPCRIANGIAYIMGN